MRRLLLATAVAGLAVVGPAALASAHPLGNVAVNTYAGVVLGTDHATVDYVLDLAELPTVQARQGIDTDGDDVVSDAEAGAYQARECASLRDGLSLAVGDRPLPLDVAATTLTFPAGQAGLLTLRLECSLQAASGVDGAAGVTFADANLGDRLGWREVTFNGDGVTLSGADVPTASISARLTAYPEGSDAPRQLSARAQARPGGPRYVAATSGSTADEPQGRGSDALTQALSGIVGGRELGVAAGALALGIAVVLGGFHSLAPGHGKTLMAAAVVGRRGTGRQVLAIGGTVAATHTTGVLVLGSVLWLTQSLAPDRLLPWLTAASGVLLAIAGATLLLRRLTGRGGLTHGHHHHPHHEHHAHGDSPRGQHTHADHAHGQHADADHAHAHADHTHGHGQHAPDDHVHDDHVYAFADNAHGDTSHADTSHADTSHADTSHTDTSHADKSHGHATHGQSALAHAPHGPDHPHDHGHHDDGHHDRGAGHGVGDQPSRRWLITMGMAGGLVPTPSALVVLLGATALGRAWFGVVLVAAYGIGMALTLLGAGLLLVRFQDWIERHFLDRSWWPVLLRVAPVVTAALLVGSGLMIAARGFATA